LEQEYLEHIRELLYSDAVQRLRRFTHHKSVTRLEHSLYVSYRSYRLAKRFGWDSGAAARGGLLHDLFFYDWREKDPNRGWYITAHPRQALEEAQARFALSDVERDIIVKHMWPLAPQLPRYRESYAVLLMDKYCACMEGLFLGKRNMKKLGLSALVG